MEMGTGKTATTINILRHRFNEQRRILRTLIFCPPIVVESWKREWHRHSKIEDSTVVPLVGSGKQRLRTMESILGDHRGRVVVTNYEALLMPDLYAAFLRWGPEAVVFDESHKLKSLDAKRTKLAIKLVDGEVDKGGAPVRAPARFRYILTGTPVLNNAMDLFAQFRALDGGDTFGRNFYAFRAIYFIDRNARMPKDRYFPDWQLRPGSLEEISRKIAARGVRVTKADCLDLPDLVRTALPVALAPDQSRIYEQMKRDFIAFVNDKACVATLAITKALRLMQIASGFAKLDDGSLVRFEDTPKLQALRELLEELTPNHKVIVWCVFRENYTMIREVCETLGVKSVEVTGDQTQREKQANVDQFNTDPETRVFISHPQAGGIGVGLQAASYSIWYSRNFSLGDDQQAESRNHRGGSEIHEKITRIDLVCGGTIEEEVAKALANKIEVSEKVLRDISLSL